MVNIIKLGDLIYRGIERQTTDENGTEHWAIPDTVETLLPVVLDTINWWVGDRVKRATGDMTKLSAANSKAIALLVKLIAELNPDTSALSANEKSAYDALLTLANSGYSDSELLVGSINAVQQYIQRGNDAAQRAMAAKSVDELIDVLNSLDEET